MKFPLLKGWKTSDKIALIGVVIAALTYIGAILPIPALQKTPPSKKEVKNDSAVPTQPIQVTTQGPNSVALGVNNGTLTVNMPAPVQVRTPVSPDTWRGEYLESLIDGDRTVSLTVNCNFKGPSFTGLSYESGYIGKTSGISGTISGSSVHFTKTGIAGDKVLFDGILDRSAKTIEGKWTGGGERHGTFVLRGSPVPEEIK